jgi:hypothetical protein
MMMTFKEFVEKFNEAVPDPKEVEKYAQDPEVKAVANDPNSDPNKLRQKIIQKKIESEKAIRAAIQKALASVPPTP